MIDRTRAFWSRKTGRILSREDAREILTNVTGFFQLLGEWDRKLQAKSEQEDVSCGDSNQRRKEIA
jgi:hypothetical protein